MEQFCWRKFRINFLKFFSSPAKLSTLTWKLYHLEKHSSDCIDWFYISVDGLSGSHFHRYSFLPGFRLFEEEGVWSTRLFPVFPSLPLPNRHTLLTGGDRMAAPPVTIAHYCSAVDNFCFRCTPTKAWYHKRLRAELENGPEISQFHPGVRLSAKVSRDGLRRAALLCNFERGSSRQTIHLQMVPVLSIAIKINEINSNEIHSVVQLQFSVAFLFFTYSSDWWSIDPVYVTATKAKASVAMFFFPECRVC